MRRLIYLFIGTAMFWSCSPPEFLDHRDLQSYLLDSKNGLIRINEVDSRKISVQYRPNDLIIDQELNGSFDAELAKDIKARYENYIYFILDLQVGEQNALYASGSAFSERLNTLSFRMAEHVQLTTSNRDTIPVADYIFQRSFGLSNSSTLLFAFNNKDLMGSDHFTLHLNEFGMGTGRQRFKFETEDIKKTPKLKSLYQL